MNRLLFDLVSIPRDTELSGGPATYIIVGAVVFAVALIVYFIVRRNTGRKK